LSRSLRTPWWRWISVTVRVQADSAEAVQAVLEGHPHTAQGGTIDVHEFIPMPGM
jgi:hypothetical protein